MIAKLFFNIIYFIIRAFLIQVFALKTNASELYKVQDGYYIFLGNPEKCI